jgi:hypothetical protein
MQDTTFTVQVRNLRNASLLVLLFSAVTVMCIGYPARAGAIEKGKIADGLGRLAMDETRSSRTG